MSTEALEQAFASTRGILANVTPEQLSAPTPCQSWQVRDLVNHLIGVSFFAADAVNTGTGESPPDTDFSSGDIVAAYNDGSSQAVAAFGAPGAQEKMITLPFGTLPGAAFLGIATTDAFVHGWDLAKATGQSTDLDPELAGHLLEGARMFVQPAFRGEDGKAPFGPEQQASPDASPADQLAAFLGRHV
jgi:uncharacterized protein (TIGR03086 family)